MNKENDDYKYIFDDIFYTLPYKSQKKVKHEKMGVLQRFYENLISKSEINILKH